MKKPFLGPSLFGALLVLLFVFPMTKVSAQTLHWVTGGDTWGFSSGFFTLESEPYGLPLHWGQGASAVFGSGHLPGPYTLNVVGPGEFQVNAFQSGDYTFNASGDTSLRMVSLAGVPHFNNFKNVSVTGDLAFLIGAVTFGGINSQITFSGNYAIGGLSLITIENGSQLNIRDNGITGGVQNFNGFGGTMEIRTSGAFAITGGTQNFVGDANNLHVMEGPGIAGGTQTFSGLGNQLFAGSAQAVSGGTQIFSGSASNLRVAATGAVTGGTATLLRDAFYSIEADHGTTAGAGVIFDKSLGGIGGVLGLNGHDTTLGHISSAQAGAGIILNGADLGQDATLTVVQTGLIEYGGILTDGDHGGKLGLTLAGSGTLHFSGRSLQTGDITVSGGSLLIDHDMSANGSTLRLDGGRIATAAGLTLDRALSVTARGGTFDVANNPSSIRTLAGTGTLTKLGYDLTLTHDSAFDGSLNILENEFMIASGVTLSLGYGDNRSAITGSIRNSGTLILNDVLSTASIFGPGALVKSGTGVTVIAGYASHTGGTSILGGTLQIGGYSLSGSVDGNIHNDSVLAFARADSVYTFGGTVSGNGALFQRGYGVLNLTADNQYTGGTTLESGSLRLGSAHAIGATGLIHFHGGVLQYSEVNTTDYSFRFSHQAGQQYKIDTNGRTITLASSLSSAGGSFTKLGDGLLILSGSNTYDGGTFVRSGTVSVAHDYNLGAASGSLTLDDGVLRTTNNLNASRSVTLAAGGGAFDVANETYLTINGPVSGEGALAKIGSGYLTLVGAQTYIGPTYIQGGFFKIESGSLASSLVNLSSADFLLADSTGLLVADITGIGNFIRGGSGVSILTGTVAQTVSTRIDSGTLQIGNGGTTGAIMSNVQNNGTLSVNLSSDYTYAGSLSGTGNVRNVGTGTLTLSGTSTAGALDLDSGATFLTGRLTTTHTSGLAAAGTHASLTLSGSGADWTSSSDTLIGHNGGSGSLLIANGATASDTFALVGRSAGSTGHVTVTGEGSAWAHSAGLVIGTGGVGTMDVTSGARVSNADGAIGGDAGSSGSVRVSGTGSLWTSTSYLHIGDAGTGVLNVDRGGIVKVGANGDGLITLGLGGAGSGTINIGTPSSQSGNVAGVIQAAEITGGSGSGAKLVYFNHHTEANYVFAPRLTGSLRVEHRRGDTTLSGANTYTGGTILTGGTLSISNDTNLGAVSGTLTLQSGALRTTESIETARRVIASGGTLEVAAQTVLTLTGSVSGFGGLSKTGSGDLILTAHNTYIGDTHVEGGRLAVNGYIAGKAIVGNGATLGGSGTIHGDVTVQNGATLAPGNSPGLLTIEGNLTLNNTSILQIEFAGTSVFDQLDVHGLFTAAGILDLVVLDGYGPQYGDTFTIFTGVLPTIGNFTLTTNLADGLSWDLSRLSSQGIVEVVPEPSTWALLVLGLLSLLVLRRRGSAC